MAIYDRPTKSLMVDWAKQNLSTGEVFNKAKPVQWFAQHYPKIKSNTVRMHIEGMSVNNHNRKHHANIKPGSGHDLFFKLGPDQYRLWVRESDPAPRYKADLEAAQDDGLGNPLSTDEDTTVGSEAESGNEFAYERDLRNYLVKNLSRIEPGLRLYEEEEITGVEFPVGGRYIDILVVDKEGRYVVIELKVSRGYDRVIGQLLRYMSWIEQNMEASRVRGIIVANEITSDLRLACSRVQDVRLIEYEISFTLRPL